MSLRSGSRIRTSTPRIAAITSADITASSGTKYGVAIQSRVRAWWMRSVKNSEHVSSSSAGPVGSTSTRSPGSATLCASQSTSIPAPDAQCQSSRNATCSDTTAGPCTCTCVSRHGPNRRSRPRYSSPTFSPPAQASHPSTITSLRWLRKFSWKRFAFPRRVLNGSTVAPARVSVSTYARDSPSEPTSSYSTWTRTPAFAFATSRSCSARPSPSARRM